MGEVGNELMKESPSTSIVVIAEVSTRSSI